MTGSDSATEEQDVYRREAMGAFAHEIRTPLTSIRMVLELGRRQGANGQVVLDEELAGMLHSSIDDLQALADDLQESSRLERGRVMLSPGPADLRAAIEAARELLAPDITLDAPEPPAVEGPWDASRLVRALAGFGTTANRIGDGSGIVRLETLEQPGELVLCFRSGAPGGEAKVVAADAGFAFFRSRLFVLAMGGSVDCTRGSRYCRIAVTLPLSGA